MTENSKKANRNKALASPNLDPKAARSRLFHDLKNLRKRLA
jgi:hypothetical protein